MALKALALLLLALSLMNGTYGAAIGPDGIVFLDPWSRIPRVMDSAIPPALQLDPTVYHHYDELTAFLRGVNAAFPQLTSLYSIGQSVQGRELWVLVISATPNEKPLLVPDVKYVGNIHGNEPVGRELILRFIQYLLVNYQRDDYVRGLVDSTRIHLMPSMNPDGFELSREGDCKGVQGRYNANGQDLNRNFPEFFKGGRTSSAMQPEAVAVSRWLKQNPFLLSGAFHGGALVASYPFDNKATNGLLDNLRGGYQASPTPDDDTFRHLATIYSFNHRKMATSGACFPGDEVFPNGTTNGAAWYYLAGGMQDFNYVWNGGMEVTLELGCCKYPPGNELPELWEDNKLAMLKYIGEAHRGVKGLVRDAFGNPISGANLRVKGRTFGPKSSQRGEYWRILLPGIYTLQVQAEGFLPYEEDFEVIDGRPTILNVPLQRGDQPVGFGSNTFADRIPPPIEQPARPAPARRPSIFSSLSSFFGGK